MFTDEMIETDQTDSKMILLKKLVNNNFGSFYQVGLFFDFDFVEFLTQTGLAYEFNICLIHELGLYNVKL